MLVDGSSQPGYSPAGGPVVALHGPPTVASAFRFLTGTEGSLVRALLFHDFQGYGVELYSARGVVEDNGMPLLLARTGHEMIRQLRPGHARVLPG